MCNYSKSLKTTLQITDENIKILDKKEIAESCSVSTNTVLRIQCDLSKEERQSILTKKKEIRLKRKNRKKAILLNIA